jgi:hypothetical protein
VGRCGPARSALSRSSSAARYQAPPQADDVTADNRDARSAARWVQCRASAESLA